MNMGITLAKCLEESMRMFGMDVVEAIPMLII